MIIKREIAVLFITKIGQNECPDKLMSTNRFWENSTLNSQ
jgi:hypothetical protein